MLFASKIAIALSFVSVGMCAAPGRPVVEDYKASIVELGKFVTAMEVVVAPLPGNPSGTQAKDLSDLSWKFGYGLRDRVNTLRSGATANPSPFTAAEGQEVWDVIKKSVSVPALALLQKMQDPTVKAELPGLGEPLLFIQTWSRNLGTEMSLDTPSPTNETIVSDYKTLVAPVLDTTVALYQS